MDGEPGKNKKIEGEGDKTGPDHALFGRDPSDPAGGAEPEGVASPAPTAEAGERSRPEVDRVPEARAEDDAADAEVERSVRAQTRRSFIVAGLAALAGLAGWRWLATRHEDDGIPWPLRRMLEINEQLALDYFNAERRAPTFPRDWAKEPRPNGDHGLDDEDFDPAAWELTVMGLADSDEPRRLTLDDIKRLPRVDMVTELKCIEGWSQVVHWAGARFADFAAQYPPISRGVYTSDGREHADQPARYVSLATPDGEYYVGLDMASALHPQTLLCYEMNGQPLTKEHGAPLRLVVPVKYGIKSIKRIGTIRFTNQRPADYWAERGYDWYAGH